MPVLLVKRKTSGTGTTILKCWIIRCQIKGTLLYVIYYINWSNYIT
jgi:hypothetical protein